MKPEYFDHIADSEMQHISSYRVENVKTAIGTVLRSRNKGLYATYNLKASEVAPGRITTDPFFRYEQLLKALKTIPNIKFMTARDALNYRPKGEEIICHIRHDIDGDILTAAEMAAVEAKYDIATSYYILHTAHYYGLMIDGVFKRHETLSGVYRRMENFGHEMALHTDGLGVYTKYLQNGAEAVAQEIEWLRSEGLTITGTVGHGSYGTYGANNYDLFTKIRETPYIPEDAKAVKHNDRWAPIRCLDESDLDLEYEGNDFFWQDHTPVEYFSLLSHNHWIYNKNWYALNDRATDGRNRERDYFDQESAIAKMKTLKGPCYLMVVVHPLHYGLRVSEDESPVTIDEKGGERNGLQIRVGKTGSLTEYMSIAELNNMGELDKPASHMQYTKNAFLFVGRENLRAESICVDGKVSQITASHFKLQSGQTAGATTLTLDAGGFANVRGRILKVCETREPTHIVLGLSAADLTEDGQAGVMGVIKLCQSKKITVIGMIEELSTNPMHSYELAIQAFETFRIPVVNPYEAFDNRVTQDVPVIWRTKREWSAHGHYLAARQLVDYLNQSAGSRIEPLVAMRAGVLNFPKTFIISESSDCDLRQDGDALVIENTDATAVKSARWVMKPAKSGAKFTVDVTIYKDQSEGRSQLQLKFFDDAGKGEHYVYVLDHETGSVYPASDKEASAFYVLNTAKSYTIRLFLKAETDYSRAQLVFVPRIGDSPVGRIALKNATVAAEVESPLKAKAQKTQTPVDDMMAMAEPEDMTAPVPKPAPKVTVKTGGEATAKVNAVRVFALSYSGTTWLNLVLGSHPSGFALGPPMRVWKKLRPDNFEGACLVHNKACDFWTSFAKEWDEGSENFLAAVAAKAGASHVFFDNPQKDFIDAVMGDEVVNVIDVRYVRDARAITASKARKLGGEKTYYETILPTGWLYPSLHRIPKPSDAPNVIYARYEDAVENPMEFFPEFMKKLGLDFTPDMLKFWETDHHITSGNVGPIGMTRLHHGQPLGNFESRDVYEKQLAEGIAAPDKPFNDQRWKTQLTREDLFFFDILMGEKNAELGYTRDVFTPAEQSEFSASHAASVTAGEKVPLPVEVVDRYSAYTQLPEDVIAALKTQPVTV